MITPAYESFINEICYDIAIESIDIESIGKSIKGIIDKLISIIKAFKDKISKFINKKFDEIDNKCKIRTYTLVNYKSLSYLECSKDMLNDIELRINSISIINTYMNASAQAFNIKDMIKSVQSDSFDNGAWSKEVSDKFRFCYTHTDNMYIENLKLKGLLNGRAKIFTTKANIYCKGLHQNIDKMINQVFNDENQRYKRVELLSYTSDLIKDTSNLIQLIVSKIDNEIKAIIKMNLKDISGYEKYKPL